MLFTAKITKETRMIIGGKRPLVGDLLEVDNRTLGMLVSEGSAIFVEPEALPEVQAPAEHPEPTEPTPKTRDEQRTELKALLDERGVNYPANAKLEYLQKLAAGGAE